ncbi:MAG: inositol monophosphatase family protein [Planctomycetota bacterium]
MALEQIDLSRMLEVAVVATRMAGQKALEEIAYTKTTIKNNTELVTQTDAHCQELIVAIIKQTYPDHGFIAEENSAGKLFKQPPRGTEPVWWVIDPIDGTNNYAHRLRCFAVSIAAMYQGQPVVAVVFEPATEQMFTAVRNGQAQLNSTRINVTDEELTVFTSFAIDSHFDGPIPPAVLQIMTQTRFRNFGSAALHLAYTASGALIGTVAFTIRLWDFAAGALLVHSAGGAITDLQGNSLFPVDLDNYNAEKFKILAANKKTHPQLLKLFNQT